MSAFPVKKNKERPLARSPCKQPRLLVRLISNTGFVCAAEPGGVRSAASRNCERGLQAAREECSRRAGRVVRLRFAGRSCARGVSVACASKDGDGLPGSGASPGCHITDPLKTPFQPQDLKVQPQDLKVQPQDLKVHAQDLKVPIRQEYAIWRFVLFHVVP